MLSVLFFVCYYHPLASSLQDSQTLDSTISVSQRNASIRADIHPSVHTKQADPRLPQSTIIFVENHTTVAFDSDAPSDHGSTSDDGSTPREAQDYPTTALFPSNTYKRSTGSVSVESDENRISTDSIFIRAIEPAPTSFEDISTMREALEDYPLLRHSKPQDASFYETIGRTLVVNIATRTSAVNDSMSSDMEYAKAESENGSSAPDEEAWEFVERKVEVGGKYRKGFHPFKMLHDVVQTPRRPYAYGESHVSALLYGVGVIVVTALSTVTLCLLVSQLRNVVQRRLDKRRRFDKSGEYERVESVSSMVDSTYSLTEPYVDGPIDDITII